MRQYMWMALLLGSAATAFGQMGEVGIGFGKTSVRSGNLGVVPAALTGLANDIQADVSANFRFQLQMTVNSWRYFGHEFGYAYNRGTETFQTSPPQSVGMSIHQGFYNFIAYATPEGFRVRPFAGGGVHFTTFYPPGTSVFGGNGVTKFGINAGGGVKVKLNDMFLLRFDVHDYFQGKPDLGGFQNQSGWLQLVTTTAGLSFTF